MKKTINATSMQKILVTLLVVIFAGIVVHTPFVVFFGSIFTDLRLALKGWKEVLLVAATFILITILIRKKQLIHFIADPLVALGTAYILIHILLLGFYWQGVPASIAGLAIDLRYVLYFLVVYITLKLYPEYRKRFILVAIAGALVVLIFAMLQVFILPYDVLKYIGYDKYSIIPYLVVDNNYDYIRINSTLRGPNPLGAYACIVLSIGFAWLATHWDRLDKKTATVIGIITIGGVTALWSSYSRSALFASVLAIVIVLYLKFGKMLSKRVWGVIGIVMLLVLSGVYVARDTAFVSQVLLHDDPDVASVSNSNEGHVNSLQAGFQRMLQQPIGGGVGSAGSASLLGESDKIIIENHYLFIAHEVGWLGLGLFIALFFGILFRLWKFRHDWLGLGVLASGIGLAFIGVLLPVWADDTVAIIWWGLAAIILASTAKKGLSSSIAK